ncbi:MAG TPA: membrane protein insertion efficiency factor YidD [Tichowtungia sp.]|nr:membrane protein insertion efficiency factor YidD [Tichowtungia sp.]
MPSTFGVLCSTFDIQFMRRLLIGLIRGYQKVSCCFPARCRFYPTCSDYTIEALRRHGIVTGLCFSLRRIGRCHPWNPGGVDFVPESGKQRTEDRRQKNGFSKLNGFDERSD